ncbi:MAG: DUF5817 domain-containing protein [Halanaeroarchaeum sp.]
MYAVVGCSDCGALWVVEGRPETTSCPRCATRHRFERLKQFHTTADAAEAKQARAAMLAKRQGHEDAFADLDSFTAMDAVLDEAGTDDEEYLAGSGIDPEAVAAAGERATGGAASRSRREVVLDAVADLEDPDEAAVVEYAAEHGVPADYVRSALAKLVRAGEVSETGGTYRRL